MVPKVNKCEDMFSSSLASGNNFIYFESANPEKGIKIVNYKINN